MIPATSFPRFGELPLELRNKIWEFCLPGPRVIPVRYDRAARQYTTTEPTPVLAQTNHESREVFLERYTSLILCPGITSSIPFSLSIDTLFFDSLDCSPEGDLASDLRKSPFKDKIERLAVEVSVWEVLRVFREDLLSEIRQLKALRKMSLVLPMDAWGGRVVGPDAVFIREGNQAATQMYGDALWCVSCLRKAVEKDGENVWGKVVPSVELVIW